MLNIRELRELKTVIALVGVLLFVVVLLFMTAFTVQSGTRKIVMTAGEATSLAGEGINFKIPFYQTTKTVDTKTLVVKQSAAAASKDMQRVSSVITVNYRYDVEKLIEIYKKTGFNIDETIISNQIQETLKSVAAKYSAEELITQREVAKNSIDSVLKKELSRYNIIVESVQLTDFNFSEEFNNAIEVKQTEVQKTMTSINILERTKIEAENRIVQARGEAEAIRIQAAAIQTQGGSEYVSLKWIEKWDGVVPEFVSGESSSVMLSMGSKK